MDPLVLVLKYTFASALLVETLVILAALVRLAREKARPEPPHAEE